MAGLHTTAHGICQVILDARDGKDEHESDVWYSEETEINEITEGGYSLHSAQPQNSIQKGGLRFVNAHSKYQPGNRVSWHYPSTATFTGVGVSKKLLSRLSLSDGCSSIFKDARL